jgi:uncharacterized protein YaaN involved in tellurite resistance
MAMTTDGTAHLTPLAPPAGEALALVPAPPAAPVPTTAAPRMAPQVPAEAVPTLDAKVETYLGALLAAPTGSPDLTAQGDVVRALGDRDIRAAAETTNRLLAAPVKALDSGQLTSGSKVGATLLELRRTVEDLDPSGLKGARKLLGFIPMGGKVVDYFRRYQSAQGHLNAILHALRDGQDELRKDNIDLNSEKKTLWATMGVLNQYIYVAERLDVRLSAQIADLRLTDPERAAALERDVLFYVRQKHQDLLTQLAASVQSYLTLDILIKNNLELIKAVDRSSTTTVSILRNAVLASQALANQKLVLDQVTALNETTSAMLERTSAMLRDNSTAIQQQAASSTVSLQSLQTSFTNLYATMDAIDTFRTQALDSMATTVGVLQNEVAKSQRYLDRARATESREGAGVLDLGPR